ncbi:hypothetical protein V8F33_011422 [Rhypophila sp. PSN 637]
MARNNSQGESRHGTVDSVTEEADPDCKACLFRAESYDLEGWSAHPDPPRNAVPLCEHVNVSWSGIDKHIATWRGHNIHMDWQACCRAFRVVCKHKDHNKPCSPEDEPTWPRARLVVGSRTQGQDPDKIYLSLEWKPHSGGRFCHDSLLPLRSDGRISSLRLRCLLQRYRKSAGGRLLSAHHSNPLPELACFSPGTDRCKCVYYDGDDDAHSLLSRSTALPVKRGRRGQRRCFHLVPHVKTFRHCPGGESREFSDSGATVQALKIRIPPLISTTLEKRDLPTLCTCLEGSDGR